MNFKYTRTQTLKTRVIKLTNACTVHCIRNGLRVHVYIDKRTKPKALVYTFEFKE